MEPKRQIVVTNLPVQIISQRVVGTRKVCLRISTQGEEAAHGDLVDLLERRLPNANPQIGDIDGAGQWPAIGVLQLITEDEIVQQPAGEGVCLRNEISRGDFGGRANYRAAIYAYLYSYP